ncbi:glutaminyl-peptide cyclotransferase [Novosphingobium sp. Rr 2-17]|uniref:glutaminyl-peptide cyclotransferase n=1 Tax=Novosphingobium sp. Rr 2-17 TaxID=555793 RepID=UPI0012F62A66|nr:glutaminyl-peptide cyclotransferase [Novosphingobium sp. Rr 2-17]
MIASPLSTLRLSTLGRRALRSLWALAAITAPTFASAAPVPVCGYKIVASFPHDPTAFTEGLLYADGLLYESTGERGTSRIVIRTLANAKPIKQADIDPTYFGEGLVDWGDQLISLTWRDGAGYRWDRKTLAPRGTFTYEGEGWGMTRHGQVIYQSDGSATLRLRDPATMRQTGSLPVRADGQPVIYLNELEWIDGEIWANVWTTSRIARIDPATGNVKAWVDLAGLRAQAGATRSDDSVLNGIAWDAKGHRLFVTGKNWSRIFQITPQCPKGA